MGNSFSVEALGLRERKQIVDQRMVTLLALYRPSKDLLSLSTHERKLLRPGLERNDLRNLQPIAQPSYSATEQLAVDLWRVQVRAEVSKRMSTYTSSTVDVPRSQIQPTLGPPHQKVHTEHRIFHIPELLDLILSLTDPETQVSALSVATFWASSALSVISSQKNVHGFRSLHVHPPIEYGQLITPELVPRRPTSDDIEQFGAHLRRLIERRYNGRAKIIYCPARYTQIRDLPGDIAQALNELDVSQRHKVHQHLPFVVARDTDVYWLDLSQFEVNPYFEQLFAREDRIRSRLGRWEINLRASTTKGHLLIEHDDTVDSLIHAIGSMHVTNPPVRCLGVYHNSMCAEGMPGFNKLLVRVRNDEGIRIAELLAALESVAPTVLETWRFNTQFLLDHRLKNAHWLDNVWLFPGVPRLSIHLDHTDMSDEVIDYQAMKTFADVDAAEAVAQEKMGYRHHITRVAYMCAEPFRAEREGEWLPEELFEPMESTTGRSPINWDT